MADMDVFNILSFPDTHTQPKAPFSSLISSKADHPEQRTPGDVASARSASPPRKIQRLETASHPTSQPVTSSGPVKIVINGSYNQRPDDGTKDLTLLHHTIRTILSRSDADRNRPLQDTYEGIYNRCMSVVCVAHKGEALYDRLKMSLGQCTQDIAKDLLKATDEGGWLEMYVDTCEWYENQTTLLSSLLTYLNQVHIGTPEEFTPTGFLAYDSFMKNIYDNSQIADRIWHCVTKWLDAERSSRTKHNDRIHIARLVKHLLTYKQYPNFEQHYMDISKAHFFAESEQKQKEYAENPQEFFKHSQVRLTEEMSRVKDVTTPGSWEMLRDVVERALLDERLQWLAKGTLPYWIEAADKDNLTALYKMYGRVGAIPELVPIFKHYVEATTISIVTNEKEDDQMIRRLITFRSNIEETLRSVLVSLDTPPSVGSSKHPFEIAHTPNMAFVYASTDAFTNAFKKRQKKPAEMLAKHLDRMLRKGQGATSTTSFNEALDKALALYRFIDDRDVFRTFYQRLLAKRLLLERSASNDDELEMLRKLKEEHDPEFSMSEDMFRDLRNSREYVEEYHSKLRVDDSEGRKLSATVLQRSAWPFTVQEKTVDLPKGLQKELDKFSDSYKTIHTNRKLDWDHALGTSTLTARFDKGTKDLTLNLYQTVILLMFNDYEEISFTDIKEEVGMEDAELRTTLQSLACGKKKVLKKVPAGRDISDTDKFVWNGTFTDPNFKVHISSIQSKVAEDKESKRTEEVIEDERRYMVDAAVVRIMKAKKEMKNERLINETIDALKAHWNPNVAFIKKRIESLIEQEYMERLENDHTVYRYVA